MTQYQIVGIGNAIVDVIGRCDDAFLARMGIDKGVMQLIETERAEYLYEQMPERRQMPGGSVANTIAGLGALGLSTAFIGRVSDDALGRYYAEAMRSVGTDFVARNQVDTWSRCFETPGAEGLLEEEQLSLFARPQNPCK